MTALERAYEALLAIVSLAEGWPLAYHYNPEFHAVVVVARRALEELDRDA